MLARFVARAWAPIYARIAVQGVVQVAYPGLRRFWGRVFDKEKLAQERKQIQQEIKQPYFPSFKSLTSDAAKTKLAPATLRTRAEATVFPGLKVHRLGYDAPTDLTSTGVLRGQISLIVLCFREFAAGMADGWFETMAKHFGQKPGVQVFELSVVEVGALRMMHSLFLRSVDRTITAPERRARFACVFSSADTVRDQLHIQDRFVPHVFLLDGQGQIRWRAEGRPDPRELEYLVQHVEQLLTELPSSTAGRKS